jgi:adenine/guanine phosphoribosyltransferase-like PRPP-binding protein
MSAAAGALAPANRPDDAEIAAALARQSRKGYLSIAEVEALGREIARRLRLEGGDPDMIVGIANGALLLTKVVATELGRPFEIVNVRRKGSRIKRRLVRLKQAMRISSFVTRGPMALFWRAFERAFYRFWPTDLEAASGELAFGVKGKNVFLVDDCVVSGASVRFVHGQLVAAGARAVTVGAICLSDDSPVVPGDTAFPAVHINRLVHFYPWSANHPDHEQYLQWLERHGLKEWD